MSELRYDCLELSAFDFQFCMVFLHLGILRTATNTPGNYGRPGADV